MPVILHPREFGLWLDRHGHEAEKLMSLFIPYPADRLKAYQVSSLVNSPVHDSPVCIEPA
jgi:putative SOS response-associated peptidase YedK